MPSLSGMSVDDARTLLVQNHLGLGSQTDQYSDQPVGTVTRCICHNEIYGKVHLRDDASIAPYKFHFITCLFVSPKKQKNAAMYFPSTSLHSYSL